MVEKRRNLCRYLDNALFNHLKWYLSKDSCIRDLRNKTSFYLFFSKWTVKLLHKYEIIAEKEFEAADTSDKGICCDVIHTEKFFSENKIISKWKINYYYINIVLMFRPDKIRKGLSSKPDVCFRGDSASPWLYWLIY